MGKVKTYWDEIKKEETHFYGGERCWEVYLRYEDRYDSRTDTTKQSLTLQFPFSTGDGVPREEKSLCRKEVMFQVKKRRELAKASSNHTEYRDLQSRTRDMGNAEFNDLLKRGLKGFNLRDYIIQNHLTSGEAYSLFYRM